MKKYFLDFKRSINWMFVGPITIIANILLFFDGADLKKFLIVNGGLFAMTILVFLRYKIETRKNAPKR
jgi:hypothetical protein